jgi:hypothetical protein
MGIYLLILVSLTTFSTCLSLYMDYIKKKKIKKGIETFRKMDVDENSATKQKKLEL